MPIEATTPTIVPPVVEAVTYPNWWITGFHIDGNNPDNVIVRISLRKYRTFVESYQSMPVLVLDDQGSPVPDKDGNPTYGPSETRQRTVTEFAPIGLEGATCEMAERDIISKAATDPNIAMVMGAILQGITVFGMAQGKL